MGTAERVVALLLLTRLVDRKQSTFATRIQSLGLTAYGNSQAEADQKAKQMFAAFVAAYRKRGTLQEKLNKGGLEWCWESEYEGDAELVSPSGDLQILHCNKRRPAWRSIGELVVV